MEDLKKSFLVRGGNVVGALGDKYFSTAPLGTVLSFAGQTAPNGYLLCDGKSYAVADYSDLYAVIGNTYGGDATNFNVPNLIDKFIQGSNTSGTEKEAGLPNITGYLEDARGAVVTEKSEGALTGSYETTGGTGRVDNGTNSKIYLDASKSNAIYGNSDTVQPPALTMVYIIKAFHTNEGVDSGVSDDVVEYVDNKVDGLISDTTSSETSTWSSKKTSDEIAKVDASLGELCNKKIYCGEVTGTTVNGVISTINPIGKMGNVIATMQYANGSPCGYSVTAQVTLSALNFYFRWHRESDDAEAYPPDGIEMTISYMIFY